MLAAAFCYNRNMYHKITGYLLLTVGLVFIFFAIVSLSKVFVGGDSVVQLIQFSGLPVQTQYGTLQIPLKEASLLINLGLFALFMVCVMTAGGHLARIGVLLLKAERIHDALLSLSRENIPPKETLKKL